MKPIGTVVAFLFFLFTASAQQHSDIQSSGTAAHRSVLLDPGISLGKPMLLLPPSLQSDAGFDIPPFLIGAGTPGMPPPFLGGAMELKADLISPFRLQMESEARFRTLRTVLGTVQVGGVAYLVYRRLKKYGLK